jgi:hypothetical protein
MQIWYILELALFVAAVQFILGAFVLYLISRHAAKPQFQSFDLLNPPLPLPRSYTQNIALLEELNFEAVAHLFAGGQATGTRSVHTVFVNPSEKDIGLVTHMLNEISPVTRMTLNYIEFSTEFEDGSEINTNNSRLPAGFVQVPEKKIFRVPHITEPQKLYAVHRAILAQSSKTNKRLPAPGEEVEELVATMKRDLAREASFGRLRLDDSGLWYRPTMKGAAFMALKFGWPVGWLRGVILRTQGKRLTRAVLNEQ